MKILRFLLMFTSAFLLAWVLIFTFIQPPFKQAAAAKILVWNTPAIPMYLYVAGAFCIGLAAGAVVALVNYFALSSNLRHVQRECAELKGKVAAQQISSNEAGNDAGSDIPPLFTDASDGNDGEAGGRQ